MMGTGGTHAIRDDIERTRARMGDTVEALGERLNPARLRQQLKDNLREATIGRVQTMANSAKERIGESGRSVASVIRENPIPAAMIVGGLGWLLFARKRADSALSAAPEPEITGSRAAWSEDAHGSLRVEQEGPVARVADGAANVAHKVSEAAQTAAHKVADQTRARSHRVAEQARAQSQRVVDSYESNPLALGFVAAGVGLAIGMALPATERESRLMGQKRDELLDIARDKVSETRERVISAAERVVPEVTSTVKEVAREEGLA